MCMLVFVWYVYTLYVCVNVCARVCVFTTKRGKWLVMERNPWNMLHLMSGESQMRNMVSVGARDAETPLWQRCYVIMALKNGKDFRVKLCRRMF